MNSPETSARAPLLRRFVRSVSRLYDRVFGCKSVLGSDINCAGIW